MRNGSQKFVKYTNSNVYITVYINVYIINSNSIPFSIMQEINI